MVLRAPHDIMNLIKPHVRPLPQHVHVGEPAPFRDRRCHGVVYLRSAKHNICIRL